MPTRFNAYRMDDGKTPLSADYFNPVFQDIDLRISDLEQRRTDLQSVIDELSKFGLQRIDALTSRAMADMTAILADLSEVREELTNGIQLAAAIVAEAVAQEATVRNAAIAAERAARELALQNEAEELRSEMGEASTALASALELATATPSAVTFSYDASGSVSGSTETLPAGQRLNTMAYGADGRLQSVTTAFAGTTRTTTFSYDAQGAVSGYSVTED
jgi:YD repeat-containing protein